MRAWTALLPLAVLVAPAAIAQATWQRYAIAGGLSAEFPAEPEKFDKWTDIAKGRVIQLTRTMPREFSDNFQAYLFLQAVIADRPYDVERKLKNELDQRSDGGDAAVSSELVSHRALKPAEMPLPGMRGIETVTRLDGFGSDRSQIEYSRSMVVGNKWLAVSVRHYEGDKNFPHDRFFRSVRWAP